ncbi:GPW/gp25 family protein [Erwiniaceae bacterium BAC15a-03b]|uniref:GPW/gp25 family protein n=1 Tax=Winslowiella arboricola TaxID=2978220 RepID=A0A9J6PSV3_9GAMM|nr:GPW/gp25 family protein [Winslowiella arboricola]MCU5773069.1 GPW/gp25 family protein [Winslowiella arboricola]MCU5777836.1 GPW/gp25 family protein [Winslowiella arboricola]
MMMYLGMNQQTGERITDLAHIRQSCRDILITPQGSRIARREYGSLLSALIDQPQNPVNRLQVLAAAYLAISRWEPRITLDSVTLNSAYDGSMTVDLTGHRTDGTPLALSVETGATSGGN